jgi:NADH-quinone oxidoreductase subunit L
MGFPYVTSGFYSKEEILSAALDPEHGCNILFGVASFTALLTSFYMTRCVIVAFFGKARSEDADHAHEAPMIMIAPLLLLALFAIASGSGLFTSRLNAMVPQVEHEGHGALIASVLALLIGSGSSFYLYWGKDKDPLAGNAVSRLLANKFYVDEIYAWIVKVFQDRLAWLVTGLESIFADGLVARLPTAIACRIGKAARAMQSGQLQGYTFVLGLGLLLTIYLVVQVLPKH